MTDVIETSLKNLRAGRDVSFFDLYSIDQLSDDDISLITQTHYSLLQFGLQLNQPMNSCPV
jgi:hypothetical protein